MDKTEVRRIIEATLSGGNKFPGLFDLPKIMGIKTKLESCDSISGVVVILAENRNLISKSFGLSDSIFDECVVKLNALRATA